MPDNRNQGQNWIWLPTRLAIYLRDRMACVWCGHSGSPLGYGLTLDHVGRSNRPRDLVTSCVSCNSARSNKPLTELERRIAYARRYRPIDMSAGHALHARRKAWSQFTRSALA